MPASFPDLSGKSWLGRLVHDTFYSYSRGLALKNHLLTIPGPLLQLCVFRTQALRRGTSGNPLPGHVPSSQENNIHILMRLFQKSERTIYYSVEHASPEADFNLKLKKGEWSSWECRTQSNRNHHRSTKELFPHSA
jgi:hypothetical protein